jgi:hypothetical protein
MSNYELKSAAIYATARTKLIKAAEGAKSVGLRLHVDEMKRLAEAVSDEHRVIKVHRRFLKTYKFWYWLHNILWILANWARNRWGETQLKQTGQRAF